MNNACQSSGNRLVILCHTDNAILIGDVGDIQTLLLLNSLDFCLHIVCDSLSGRDIIIGGIRWDLCNSLLIQLHELHAIPNMHGVVSHAEVDDALNLTRCGQGRHHLSALSVLSSALKHLQRIGRKVQCVQIFRSQSIISRFRTIRKFYFCHIFPPC